MDAINKNENWIWDQYAEYFHPQMSNNDLILAKENWSLITYCNLAMLIVYGSRFPDRIEQVNKLRNMLLSLYN